jgi:kynurenine formamidase
MNQSKPPSEFPKDRELTRDEVAGYLIGRSNWGRWGDDDQLGALNLITAEKRQRAARLVRSGTVISLSRPIPTTPSPTNPAPALHAMKKRPRDPGGGMATDYLGVACHGLESTHIDALCHVWSGNGMWNGRDPEEEITFDGAMFGDIDKWRDGIVTRGVLIDVPRHRETRYVDLDRPVHGSELEDIVIQNDIVIEAGDALVVYSGRDAWDIEHGPWGAISEGAGLPTGREPRPGLHASCLHFLREHDIAVLVWDMMDAAPNEFDLPWTVHAAIWAFGVALVDNALLGHLAAVCAAERRHDFMMIVSPLRLQGGTGSSVNPLAVL